MQRSFLTSITAGTVAAVVLSFGIGLAPASADDSDGPTHTTSTEHDGGTGFALQTTSQRGSTDTSTVSETATVDTVETGTASETETVDTVETGTVTASETETVDTLETGTASETETEIVHPHETTETGTTGVFGLDTSTALTIDTSTAAPVTALADLDPSELEQASPEQFGTVSASDVRRFTPAQVHVLDTAQFQALGSEARGALTRSQAHSLRPATVARAGDALLALSPMALAALPIAALRHLRGSSWLRDLTPSQIAGMNARQVKALGLRAAGLSTEQRVALATALRHG